MVGEVPVAQVEQRLLHAVAINVDFCGGKHSIGRIDDSSRNADIEALFVSTTTKQPQYEDAHNTCREDGVEREQCSQNAFAAPEYVEAGDANGANTRSHHHPLAKTQLLLVGSIFLEALIVVLHGDS